VRHGRDWQGHQRWLTHQLRVDSSLPPTSAWWSPDTSSAGAGFEQRHCHPARDLGPLPRYAYCAPSHKRSLPRLEPVEPLPANRFPRLNA
jgi:hypothetical protein